MAGQIGQLGSQSMTVKSQLPAVPATLVRATEGFSGAEVVATVSEAAMLALEMGETSLGLTRLLEAANETRPQITQEMKEFYAAIQADFDLA